MERKLVTIETIQEKRPIDGADLIESVRVRGWWVVSKKDEFSIGDKCIYFEIDSFLPNKPEYAFLLRGSSPRKIIVEGKEIEGIKLKTIKLRDTLSQGLVLPITDDVKDFEVGTDVSSILGVIKYDAPVSAQLSGQVKGSFPSFIPKTDEERIQNMASVLDNTFYVSEKLDGTSATFYRHDNDGEIKFGVCSRNLELQEGETVYWKIAKELKLMEKLPVGIVLQGEIVGEGIQGNPLKLKGQQLFAFSVYNISYGKYLGYSELINICSSIGVKTVPILDDNFTLPKTVEEMLQYAEGKSALNKEAEREGVVVRPKREQNYRGSRLSFKAISNKYLLTEND